MNNAECLKKINQLSVKDAKELLRSEGWEPSIHGGAYYERWGAYIDYSKQNKFWRLTGRSS